MAYQSPPHLDFVVKKTHVRGSSFQKKLQRLDQTTTSIFCHLLKENTTTGSSAKSRFRWVEPCPFGSGLKKFVLDLRRVHLKTLR